MILGREGRVIVEETPHGREVAICLISGEEEGRGGESLQRVWLSKEAWEDLCDLRYSVSCGE